MLHFAQGIAAVTPLKVLSGGLCGGVKAQASHKQLNVALAKVANVVQPGPRRKMLLIAYAAALCARDCSGKPATERSVVRTCSEKPGPQGAPKYIKNYTRKNDAHTYMQSFPLVLKVAVLPFALTLLH